MLQLINAINTNYKSVSNYYRSFKYNMDELNSYALSLLGKSKKSYLDYIMYIEKDLYFLIDDNNPDYIIGYGCIKHYNKYLKYTDEIGNISYGVRKSERNKGYGTKILELLLEKCIENNINEVFISCLKSNIASKKVIENNGGKLEKEFINPIENSESLKYKIKLKEKVKIKK